MVRSVRLASRSPARRRRPLLALLAALLPPLASCAADTRAGTQADRTAAAPLHFAVTYGADRAEGPLDGRLLLMISAEPDGEPRFQIGSGATTQLVFGIDVDGWRPGEEALFDASVFGYPVESLGDVPAGTYRVQALLNRYETFHRADGHVVKLPPDRGEGQQWNRKPGNLYSEPLEVRVDPSRDGALRIELDREIPELPRPPETRYVRYTSIQSDLLTEFWGTPTNLGAWVLVPEGFDDRPDARYPLALFHGHFPYEFTHIREEPPDPDLECVYSERFRLDCYNRIQQEWAHQLYLDWTSPGFPRHLVVEIQHPTPYYDDSYAVNSQNNGPYGDAIMHELVPHIEREFRGLGEGWARITYGGSTGGWEAMAAQVFYPDDLNGAWIACPDPIDFRAYTVVNLYEDRNAYRWDARWKRTPRPGIRDWLGRMTATLEELNQRERVLGSRGRSGDQWDIWQAVYSPVGEDGYPKPIWDKRTGEIDRAVAEHWRENYDLVHILRRDWATLGPKLRGKLRIYVGDLDNYYLDNAVYLAEEFLESTTDPYYEGVVDYGDRAEHCWNGDHERPNAISRLRYIQMAAPWLVERIRATAPPGADTVTWRY